MPNNPDGSVHSTATRQAQDLADGTTAGYLSLSSLSAVRTPCSIAKQGRLERTEHGGMSATSSEDGREEHLGSNDMSKYHGMCCVLCEWWIGRVLPSF